MVKFDNKIFWKCNSGYLDVPETKEKVSPHITHSMRFLVLLHTISLQLVASYKAINVLHICLSLLYSYICSLTETMPRKFQESSESRFCGSKKDLYVLKIPKWEHKLVC